MLNVDLTSPIPVVLDGGRGYSLYFQSLSALPHLLDRHGLRKGRCLIITDTRVAAHYHTRLINTLEKAGWTAKTVIVPPGEESKSMGHLKTIYDAALSWPIDRKTPVLALGGGVVGDLAGFAAATLLRGVPVVQLPTTLIAQVDSAIGGKTGINHEVGKNLIGAFHQPVLVCTDLNTLDSLPVREWTSGLAEVVKHALIADRTFFEFLEAHWDHILTRNHDVIGEMIYRAAQIKANVVSKDEREAGLRAILNFGHTFGHAIEKVAGYGLFTHGEAVALGMQAALALSHRLNPGLDIVRSLRLIRRIPVIANLSNLLTSDLMAAMQVDKKTEAGQLRFVVLRDIGEAYVTKDVETDDILAAWASARDEMVYK